MGVDAVTAALDAAGIAVELGPDDRSNATGPIVFLNVRDPHGTLVELAQPA